jgi:hypothetical protein
MALHSYYPSPATKEREKSFSSKRLKTTTDFWLLRDLFIGLVLLSPNTVRGSSFFVLMSLVFHCLAQAKLDGGHPPLPQPLRHRAGPRAHPWPSPRRRTV